MITIKKETPHMFMWFSDGLKIPKGISPLPQNSKLNYVKRLKEECAKLYLTKTPAYLIYMGRLLNREQKTLLEDLQQEIPNLAVIDYDEVERGITNEQIKSKVSILASEYQKQEKLNVGTGGIADLVDLTRLILLYNSKILRDIAQKKLTTPLKWCQGLVYRDFDVTLEKESMPDIPTQYGYMATLNFLEKTRTYHNGLLESTRGVDGLTQRINTFFNTHIYNLERYQQILRLFITSNLNLEEQKAKQEIILEYKKIGYKEHDFKHFFVNLILIENSFLAINIDQHPFFEAMIKEVCTGDSPYGAVQKYFHRGFRGKEHIYEYLKPQLLGFHIGNDLTWKIEVKQQHQSAAAPKVDVLGQKNQKTVTELSILTKKYLRHLDENKVDLIGKKAIIKDLNAILDNTFISSSKKLHDFATRLQAADKALLKKHREPAWAAFKKTALFFLGITGIGAVVGGIDYIIRGHHSIFYASKSHGERFVLDIEEYIPRGP